MTPLQRYEAMARFIVEWAVFVAQGGLDRFRREKS